MNAGDPPVKSRIFVWLHLPEPAQKQVEEWRSQYGPRLITRYQSHITVLKPFSTYHPDQYLEAITQVLTKYPQVRVNFDGIRISNRDGMFPSSLMIKVINSSDLYVLRRELLKVAPNTSKRPYRAHLTLGHAEKLEKTSVYRYFSEQQLVRTSLNAVPVLYHKRGCELQQIEAA